MVAVTISGPGAEMQTPPRAQEPTAGFTLMELVVILAILGVIAGMSIGAYQEVARQNILPASASRISSIIRSARNFSVSSSLPSRVYVDTRDQRVSAFGFELVASWSFEELEIAEVGDELERGIEIMGAFREPAEAFGVIEVGDGKIGRGLVFLDEGASLVAPRRPRYDSPRGFSLEAWIQFYQRPLDKGEGSRRDGSFNDPRREEQYAILSRPGSWEFGVLGDGALYAVIGDADTPSSDQTFVAATASGEVLGSRWSHVRASFDGLELILEVNGTERPWAPEGFERVDERDWPELPTEVPAGDFELMVSHPKRFFYGGIDEVKVRIALEPQTFDLPDEVRLLGKSRIIRFDSRGGLDPIHHSNPVVVRVGELGDDAAVEVETPGGTAVALPTPEEEEAAAREAADARAEEILGDPMAALARYLEEQQVAAEKASKEDPLEGDGSDLVGEGEADASATAEGMKRLHQIIVDLTGTIRG